MRNRKGFTLVEMLIVMVIIAILAAIVLPRILAARQKANEANAKSTLEELRKSVKEFESDMGFYPAELTDVVLAPASTPAAGKVWGGSSTGFQDYTGVVDANSYRGPYVEVQTAGTLPVNKVTGGEAIGADWVYDLTSNKVVTMGTAATGDDTTGVPYADW